MESHGENIKSNETTTRALASTSQEEFDQIDGEHAPQSSKKRRKTTEGNVELFFKLYKFSEVGEQYILEMYEAKSGSVDRYYLFAKENNGKWEARVYDLAPGTYVVFAVVKDPFTITNPPKRVLSLQERLNGWTAEKRKRDSEKQDKFYYHGGKQFRSLVEVTTFILYSTKSKDLESSMFRIADQVISSATCLVRDS